MMTVFFASIVLLAIAIAGMAIGILIKKNGRFPELHIGKNKYLKEKGIDCATSQDRMARKEKNNT